MCTSGVFLIKAILMHTHHYFFLIHCCCCKRSHRWLIESVSANALVFFFSPLFFSGFNAACINIYKHKKAKPMQLEPNETSRRRKKSRNKPKKRKTTGYTIIITSNWIQPCNWIIFVLFIFFSTFNSTVLLIQIFLSLLSSFYFLFLSSLSMLNKLLFTLINTHNGNRTHNSSFLSFCFVSFRYIFGNKYHRQQQRQHTRIKIVTNNTSNKKQPNQIQFKYRRNFFYVFIICIYVFLSLFLQSSSYKPTVDRLSQKRNVYSLYIDFVDKFTNVIEMKFFTGSDTLWEHNTIT